MAPQSYTTDKQQQRNDYPTSPWTETFRACMAQETQSQPAHSTNNRQAEDETQSPTQEALSAIYNRGY